MVRILLIPLGLLTINALLLPLLLGVFGSYWKACSLPCATDPLLYQEVYLPPAGRKGNILVSQQSLPALVSYPLTFY